MHVTLVVSGWGLVSLSADPSLQVDTLSTEHETTTMYSYGAAMLAEHLV